MLIRSLHLRNIRSYVDASIDFPQGTVLLAGDIGSGKSTILLAIEFAIFGIMKGLVATSSLLRHGANSGEVELKLIVEKEEVIIKRSLKRTTTGITQDSGSIQIGKDIFEGTPQELKSRILELLGYPESLLNKSKSLIFRYTVFTPQEVMKRILYESKEERLDILRRLFNIDKYKRVKDNALNITRDLKGQVSFLEGKLAALPNLKKEIAEETVIIEKLRQEAAVTSAKLSVLTKDYQKKALALETLEEEFEQARALERSLEVKKAEHLAALRELERVSMEDAKLKVDIDALLGELQGFNPATHQGTKEKIQSKKEELARINSQLDEIRGKIVEYSTRKSASELLIKKITGLDKCPTCLQQVSPAHCEDVKIREHTIIQGCTANLDKLAQFKLKYEERKKAAETELDNYSRNEREVARLEVKFTILDEKKKRREALAKEKERLATHAASLKSEGDALALKWELEKPKKGLIVEAKKEVDAAQRLKAGCESELSATQAKLGLRERMMKQQLSELDALRADEAKLNSTKLKKTWLENDFIQLVDSIEKSVLSRIYSEFNSYFESWFSALVEDESMSARLDDSFSPVIVQNGYETFIENLSGGEKTSVALAYRLSLNKVINDFLTSIRTRDLIILDEPTEGFSSEQLDRVRDVLAQANSAQTLIVSHEPKMEGFVEHIIRIRKQGHASQLS